jgi:hypothetical protein
MNPIISSPGAEYICPSCGKKSKLPLNVPKFGVFKVACFYCKYISEIQFDIQPMAVVEEPEFVPDPDSDNDQLNPIHDLPDPFADRESGEVSLVEEEPLLYVPVGSVTDSENPVDSPMDLDSFYSNSEEVSINKEESVVFKAKEEGLSASSPVVPEAKEDSNDSSPNALVPYTKLEFSNKFIGKVADILDIEKISVPEDQYVPIFEVKKIPIEK